jgi:uncharacterized protein YycO
MNLLTLFGDIGFVSRFPAIKGKDIIDIIGIIRPGDIIGRSYKYFLDTYFIPGKLSHSGVYIGNDKIVHSVSPAVEETHIIDFIMGTDKIAIVRPTIENKTRLVDTVLSFVGAPYDGLFNKDDSSRFYCHELVYHCLMGCDVEVNVAGKYVLWDNLLEIGNLIYSKE